MENVTGIVLCGGKSSRMGKNKGLCTVNGKPLIDYPVKSLEPICDKLIIGSNDPVYMQFGWPVVGDKITDIGPIGGIFSCLEKSDTEHNLILSCDMPFAGTELMRFLFDQRSGYRAVVPSFRGYPEPLCGYYHRDTRDDLLALIKADNYKLQNVLHRIKTNIIQVDEHLDFYKPWMFLNVNTEDQLIEDENIAQKMNHK
jgi:molybdopterin-guanine dinucleotide biosynthesis protein A